jgi:VanZ family protein
MEGETMFIAPVISNLGTRWIKWPVSRPATSTAAKTPNTHRIRCWLSPRAVLEILDQVHIFCSYRESNHESSVAQPIFQSLHRLRYRDLSLILVHEEILTKTRYKLRVFGKNHEDD